MKWEIIDTKDVQTERAKIPGGWLLRFRVPNMGHGDVLGGMTFVPDADHKWNGKSLP